jgi:hypothetical protein
MEGSLKRRAFRIFVSLPTPKIPNLMGPRKRHSCPAGALSALAHRSVADSVLDQAAHIRLQNNAPSLDLGRGFIRDGDGDPHNSKGSKPGAGMPPSILSVAANLVWTAKRSLGWAR